jgi:UDP-glucuronate 4-epimerase
MECASRPPLVVNWSGSETVSIEDYCGYLGALVGREPIFEYSADAHTPLWPDTTHMHATLGRTRTPWRDGMRAMVKALHPDMTLTDE